MNVIIIAFLSSFVLNVVLSEVYSSIEDLKYVLEIENDLAGVLKNYVEMEKRKVELLERYVKNQKQQQEIALKDIESYVGNPINVFLLIKRLTTDWKNFENLLADDNGQEFLHNATQYKQDPKFPTLDDFGGIVTGLFRLQKVYGIDAQSFINGVIGGKQYNSTLSVSDCYEIGKEAYASGEYYRAIMWLDQANTKLQNERITDVDKTDILKRLALAFYRYGYVELAVKYTKELLKISPDQKEALDNLALFTESLGNGIEEPDHKIFLSRADELCKKSLETAREIPSQLRCSYINNNNPFLLIAPFKAEELYLNPRIVVFHDIISDEEIEMLKNTSEHLMRRSVVIVDRSTRVTDERTSKNKCLVDDATKSLLKINKRMADMTDLNMEAQENLQVTNYGVGGHYMAHYDFIQCEHKKETHRGGNRIATVLFYLSDVEQGGATVFPALNVTIIPKKGTAAVWHNLDVYGDGLITTLHAACPVLYGSKWIATKWIREAGQELLRPCPLHKVKNNYTVQMSCT